MTKFANNEISWLNDVMKNTSTIIKEKLIARYLEEDKSNKQNKSTNINVLLNRVKTNQKNEVRKKIYFSAAASTGLILFGLIIF
jgi:hypothetical protein|tara:strand:+ start:323 stop:574 length:252 start_codon:yes stop_codon:yes gene_type:complete